MTFIKHRLLSASFSSIAFVISFSFFSNSLASNFVPYSLLDNHKTIGGESQNQKVIEPIDIETERSDEEMVQYQKYFAKIQKWADVLDSKNIRLANPVAVSDTLWCMKNETLQSFSLRGASAEEAFNQLLRFCSFTDLSTQVSDRTQQERIEYLQNIYISHTDVLIPDYVIHTALDSYNWDESTQTLLGNQYSFSHVLDSLAVINIQQKTELQELGIEELISVGISNYRGSDSSRKTNIRNAASKLDGKIIHPSQNISVVNTLAPFSYENGYTDGIILKEGEEEKEIGGGVCQSVTTLFRAWQNSGLEITSFRPHSKSIGYYGNIGLDATIYKSNYRGGDIDLLLTNNSQTSVLIKVIDHYPYQLVLMYGTKDRHVTVERTNIQRDSVKQTAEWKRMVQYNMKGDWVENSFRAVQKR